MSDAKTYRDGSPVPAVADRCPRSTVVRPEDLLKHHHLCKKPAGHEPTPHKCICDLEWDHLNSKPLKDL